MMDLGHWFILLLYLVLLSMGDPKSLPEATVTRQRFFFLLGILLGSAVTVLVVEIHKNPLEGSGNILPGPSPCRRWGGKP